MSYIKKYGNLYSANYYYANGASIWDNIVGNTITIANTAQIGGNATIGGNLIVAGNIIRQNELNVGNVVLILAGNANTSLEATGAGIQVGNANYASFLWDSVANTWYTGISNISAGNFVTTGDMSVNDVVATGNVTSQYILSNGYYLTGIRYSNLIGAYGNSNVAAYLPTYTGNLASLTGNVITTGNVQGSYILGNGAFLTGLPASYSNANVANYLQILTSNITTTANIQANYFIGNGRFLTGLPASYSNANVANYLPNYQGLFSNIQFRSTSPTAAAIIVNDRSLTIGGNILSYIIIPNDANANSVAAELTNHGTGNVIISSGPADHEWVFGPTGNLTAPGNIYTTANVQAGNFTGAAGNINLRADGYGWTFDTTGNLTLPANTFAVNYANGTPVSIGGGGGTGDYSNANVANYLPIYTGNISASNLLITGGIANLGPAGNVKISGGNVNYYLVSDGAGGLAWAAGTGNITGNGSVAGADQQIQFNNGTGNFAASPALKFDYTANTLRVEGNIVATNYIQGNSFVGQSTNTRLMTDSYTWTFDNTGNLTAPGNITTTANIFAGYFIGNGALLTGIGSSYSNANVANYLASNTNLTVSVGTGNITTQGNISGNYFIGNGAFLTGIVAGTSYSNANVANYLASNAAVTILTTGNITTSSNISGNYILGNGAFLTGIVAGTSYSNANVANYLASNANVTFITTGNITSAANISAAYFLGNATFAEGVSNTYFGNVAPANPAQGDIWIDSDTGIQTIYFVDASGGQWAELEAMYSFGSGSGGGGGASNAEVVAYGEQGWAGNIVPAANVTYSLGNSTRQWSNLWVASNTIYIGGVAVGVVGNTLTVANANVITSTGNNSITTSGNISGSYILGNGYFLSGIGAGGGYSNATVASYLASNANINIITQGAVIANAVGGVEGAVTKLNVFTSGMAYVFDQYTGTNPDIYITAGQTIGFALDVVGHPFLIRENDGGPNYDAGLIHISGNGSVNYGSDAQGQTSGTLYWKVPIDVAGNTLVYQCQVHSSMVGNVVISNPAAIALTSDRSRYVFVSSAAPASFQGNIGDIWYQTY
jgi:hypothetical protein